MASLTMYVLLLCFCHVSVFGQSQSENDDIELLKCKIEALEKSSHEQNKVNEQMKSKIEYLEMREQRHNYSLTKLIKKASKLSTYCSLLPTDICGECECLDDYENEKKYFCDCQHLIPKRDCLEFLQHGYKKNGVYRINTGGIKPMQVYCDQETDNGGWTVFQRRINGEINFYRDWQQYKHGFGTLQREFWLGNDNIYVLTLQSAYPKGSELRIDMTDWSDTAKYAKYNMFQVDNESTKYMLHVGGYSGNAGNSFASHHDKHGFSTYDRDNDSADGRQCSRIYRGAWWFDNCFSANLNGEYWWFDEKQPGYARGVIWWNNYGNKYSLKHVDMKVRRKL